VPKLQQPYQCDYCPTTKGESNHWWMREKGAKVFILRPWNDFLAKTDDFEYICGVECAHKALAKYMAANP